MNSNHPTPGSPDSNSRYEVTPFTFPDTGSSVRTITIDGEPWFVGRDVLDALGLGNPTEAMRSLDDDEFSTTEVVDSAGRRQPNAYIVNEPGLYSLILRSRKPQAKAFKRWVTHEVIPSIRKTGRYEMPLDDPLAEIERQTQLTARAIEIARRERAHREAAEQKARQLEPAATAWERLASTNGDFSVRIAANILNRDPNIHTGQNRLFAFIRGMRMVDRGDVPYSSHSQHLRLKPGDAYTDRRTGETKIGDPKLRVTVRGLQYLHKRLDGVVPISYHVQAELTQDGEQDAA